MDDTGSGGTENDCTSTNADTSNSTVRVAGRRDELLTVNMGRRIISYKYVAMDDDFKRMLYPVVVCRSRSREVLL